MPGLRELQLGFAAAVLRRQESATVVPDLRPADERLARRLSVYRINARENFAAALEAAYPVLRRQLGDAEFRSLAWSYQSRHPSVSGNLFETGRRLPQFLAEALPGTGQEHLADLARLEWAVQESMVAADSASKFDPQALADIPADRHETLRLAPHPSVRILQLEHPVFDLWRDFHAGRDATSARPPGPERIIVRRSGTGIELHQIDALEHRCLECLLRGGSLGEVTDAALEISDAPDIGSMLARWAARGVITRLVAAGDEAPGY